MTLALFKLAINHRQTFNQVSTLSAKTLLTKVIRHTCFNAFKAFEKFTFMGAAPDLLQGI